MPLLAGPTGIVTLPRSFLLDTDTGSLTLRPFATSRLSVFADFSRTFMVKEVYINLCILLFKLLMRHQIFLLAIVVSLLRTSSC